MDVTQENIIQVWRVMVLHRSTQIYQHKLSFEVGGSLKGEISIQIIKTARLKDERTGMVLKYLLNTHKGGGRGVLKVIWHTHNLFPFGNLAT